MISNLFQHKTPQGITHTSNRKMGAALHISIPFNFCWAFDNVDVHEEEDEDKRKHIWGKSSGFNVSDFSRAPQKILLFTMLLLIKSSNIKIFPKESSLLSFKKRIKIVQLCYCSLELYWSENEVVLHHYLSKKDWLPLYLLIIILKGSYSSVPFPTFMIIALNSATMY